CRCLEVMGAASRCRALVGFALVFGRVRMGTTKGGMPGGIKTRRGFSWVFMFGLPFLKSSPEGVDFTQGPYAMSRSFLWLRSAVAFAVEKKRRQVRHGESVLWRTAARLRAAPARQALQISPPATENIGVN